MARPFHGYRTFFREFRGAFHTTGSVLPSSPFLASALARYVREGSNGSAPRRILEVGPGTGPVTSRIVGLLGEEDRLDLVELNATFVEVLERRFETDPRFQQVRPRTRILHQAVEDLPADEPYDAIVSGLPLNNFSVEQVERILGLLTGLLRPGGTLSFFEYVAVRFFRGMASKADEKQRLRGIERALREVLDRSEIRRDMILANVPPAWVHHVRPPV